MNNFDARILIYDKDGKLKPIQIYKDGNGRKWVEAHDGTRFVIEVNSKYGFNDSLAVVSVDGLNVINGERAIYEAKNGYVLSPRESLKIKGWRTGMNSIREFVFTIDKNKSYSHKLGADESNIGVIGFIVFNEYVNYTYGASYTTTYSSSPMYYGSTLTSGAVLRGVADNSVSVNNCTLDTMSMATAQGDRVEDKAIKSSKTFLDSAEWEDAIYYDSRENLIKRGIINTSLPKPFEATGFCPDL